MCTYAKILISEKIKLILVVVFTQAYISTDSMGLLYIIETATNTFRGRQLLNTTSHRGMSGTPLLKVTRLERNCLT